MNEALVLKVASLAKQCFLLRAIRTVRDDSGVICHFEYAGKTRKTTYAFDGMFSKRIEDYLRSRLPTSVCRFQEANVANGQPYIWGTVTLEDALVTVSIDPAGSLSVRFRKNQL